MVNGDPEGPSPHLSSMGEAPEQRETQYALQRTPSTPDLSAGQTQQVNARPSSALESPPQHSSGSGTPPVDLSLASTRLPALPQSPAESARPVSLLSSSSTSTEEALPHLVFRGKNRKQPASTATERQDVGSQSCEEVQSCLQDSHSSVSLITGKTIDCSCKAALDAISSMLQENVCPTENSQTLKDHLSSLEAVTRKRMLENTAADEQRPVNHNDCLLYSYAITWSRDFFTREKARAANNLQRIHSEVQDLKTAKSGNQHSHTTRDSLPYEEATSMTSADNQGSKTTAQMIRDSLLQKLEAEESHSLDYLTGLISGISKFVDTSTQPFERFCPPGKSICSTTGQTPSSKQLTTSVQARLSSDGQQTEEVSIHLEFMLFLK